MTDEVQKPEVTEEEIITASPDVSTEVEELPTEEITEEVPATEEEEVAQ